VPLSPSSAARLATQLECLPALLEGVAPEALARRTRAGKWSVHENLAHLARHHAIVIERVKRILAEEGPALARYTAEDDPEWPAWAALPTTDVLAPLRTSRTELALLVTSLSDEQLARTGVHPAFGAMSLALWIEFFLVHEAHHLYLVFKRARGGD